MKLLLKIISMAIFFGSYILGCICIIMTDTLLEIMYFCVGMLVITLMFSSPIVWKWADKG